MSILITGGSGWIGTGLAHRLAARGEDLILFDNAPDPGRVGDIMDKVRIVRGDVKVWPEVMNLVKENGVEGIFHLSGLNSSASDLNPWASYETNVTGSMHVLEAARLFGVKRVLFTSTMGSYGLGIPTGTITDETLQRPTTMYGAGKVYIELLGRYYRRRFGLDFRCLRYPNVFSPRSIIHPKLQYVAWMIQSAALGEPAEIPVTPESKLPPLYYEDALRATEMLYDAPKEAIETVCYNVVGTFPSPTARQVELAIREIIPDAAFTYAPDPWIMNYYGNLNDFDDSCARTEWGWQAAHADLGTVVAAFIREVRAKPDLYRQALERPFLGWPPMGA